MKKFFWILPILLLVSCQNLNVAWRGQVTVYSTNNRADTDGKITNSPRYREGSKSITAPKEYSDAFKTETKVDGTAQENAPTRDVFPSRDQVENPNDTGDETKDLPDVETVSPNPPLNNEK